MKNFISLILSSFLFFNLLAQNKIENKSYEVSYAAFIDLKTNTKVKIDNLRSFKTERKDSSWDTEFSCFQFYLDDEEYYFMSEYKNDSIDDGNLVQKFKQIYVTNKAEILVYHSSEVALENGVKYNLAFIIPDFDNDKLYLIQILDEALAVQNSIDQNKTLIIDNPAEEAHWSMLEEIIAEISESSNLAEFKGEEDTNQFFPDIYEVNLKKVTSYEPLVYMNYTEPKNIYSDKTVQNLDIFVRDMGQWVSIDRGEILQASDIATTEILFDKYLLDNYIKVYKPSDSGPYDYDVIGEKVRENIMDDIYYINKKEKNVSLSKLQMSYVKIDLSENGFSKNAQLVASIVRMD